MSMHSVLSRMMATAGLVALAATPLAAQAKLTSTKSGVLTDGSTSVFSPVMSAASQTLGLDLVFNVAGIQSVDGIGAPGNTRFTIQALPGALVDFVAWNVTLEALGASWLSELGVSFTNTAGNGVNLRPGAGTNTPGVQSFSGSGSLVDAGLSFNLEADGLLVLEFYESFDDGPGTDGIWQSGTLTFGGIMPVPEPSTYGLMALGLLGVAAAARRRKAD